MSGQTWVFFLVYPTLEWGLFLASSGLFGLFHKMDIGLFSLRFVCGPLSWWVGVCKLCGVRFFVVWGGLDFYGAALRGLTPWAH